jgi:CO/xanthine dehydrogenase Mo-binding subunit
LLLGFQANSTPGHAEDRFYRFNVDRDNARRHVCNPTDLSRRSHSDARVPRSCRIVLADVLRYVGEPVAMVLADTAELADDAAQAVSLDIEPPPGVVDRRASMRNDV